MVIGMCFSYIKSTAWKSNFRLLCRNSMILNNFPMVREFAFLRLREYLTGFNFVLFFHIPFIPKKCHGDELGMSFSYEVELH